MKRTLLLFDIDGTILITKGAGSRAMKRAMRDDFGEDFQFGPITVGTLDPQIFAQLAVHNGIHVDDQIHQKFKERYLQELKEELQKVHDDVTVLPGIRTLLVELHDRARHKGDVMLGLQTGNYGEAVAIKLAAAGIDQTIFEVQVVAEDGRRRGDLPRVAMHRYEQLAGEPADTRRVCIIGDTPRDVECARENGCLSLCVATGRYSVAELKHAGADLVLDNLADPTPLYRFHDQISGQD